ncbi:MAG: TetR/AcrR family transcriptional regulator [Devosia nanyangense]|uniref:TetR/AcrR family transcriptional regulator n=1 Tax=Devosia nanyangense TaxID=1228055 RepID=A0A933P0X1_9HYPH|nr:TetR/AcrR family transcriptional regulator [Devosia nanyangense]
MKDADSRDAIKQAALDLLIRHGYRGMTFGDIADRLGTTRANIHYHFGSKQRLIDDVLADYVDTTLAALRMVWGDRARSLADKIEAMLDYSRDRFRRYNPDGGDVQPWSLISRLRQDADLLTPKGREQLRRFGTELTAIFVAALQTAQRDDELVPGLTAEDAALQLAIIANNAAPITFSAGRFERLEMAYRGFGRLVARRQVPD